MPVKRGAPPQDELISLQRKCAEQANEIAQLQLKQAMFDSLLNFLPEHIYFKDKKSCFIAVGQAMKDWFGAKSIEEVIGKSDFDLFTKEHAQQAFNDEEKILSTGKPIKEKREKETWEDGRITWVSTCKAPIRDPSGDIIGTFGISRDITQQRIADERLHEATKAIWDERNLLQTVIDLVPDAIYVKDDQHKIVLSNRTHLSMLGKEDESEVIGKTEDIFYAVDTLNKVDNDEKNVIKNNQSLINVEEKRTHPVTHQPIWLSTSKVALKNYKLKGIVCVSRDISNIKQALDNLKSAKNDAEIANQAKSEFLAKMSHEIRTPLNGIIGLTQCIIDSKFSTNQLPNLHTIKESADLLLQIINDLLDFSTIETGVLALKNSPFNLRTMIEDLMDIVFFNFGNREIESVCIIDDNVPNKVLGDTGRLRQVLINILNNAKKFTHQGLIILRISATGLEGNKVRIKFSIEDTGIGIDEDQIDKIFLSFAQADDSITRQYGGTGLGLAISQKLAQLMGGEIKVISPSKRQYYQNTGSRGSIFYFTAAFETTQANEEPRPALELTNKKIMLLACSEPTQESLSLALHSQKVKIIIALNCTQAASLVSLHDIDVLITDKSYALTELSQNLTTYLSNHRKPALLMTQQGIESENDTLNLPYPFKLLTKPLRRAYLIEGLIDLLSVKSDRPSERTGSGSIAGGGSMANGGLMANTSLTANTGLMDSPFEKLKKMAGDKRILLVEDNPVNQQVAVANLERVGISVDIAENGKTALKIAEETDYDLILMDLQMPVMDGLTATRELRKKSRFKTLPIIALTAQAMKGDLESCLEAGMNDYISKPIKAQHFYKMLYFWLIQKGS